MPIGPGEPKEFSKSPWECKKKKKKKERPKWAKNAPTNKMGQGCPRNKMGRGSLRCCVN